MSKIRDAVAGVLDRLHDLVDEDERPDPDVLAMEDVCRRRREELREAEEIYGRHVEPMKRGVMPQNGANEKLDHWRGVVTERRTKLRMAERRLSAIQRGEDVPPEDGA